MDEQERYDKGMARRRQVLGNAWVDRANAKKTPFTEEFQDFITRAAWGEIWTRPHYDERTRRVLVIGTMIALAAAGFRLSELALVVGALSVGIGFGLQNVVNNFVSGLILMFERPIQPGDVIEVSGTSGKVRDIGMRATTLVTFEGADVVVPNGTLLSEKLTNWTLSDTNRRMDVNVGVAYGSDPHRVLALLAEVAGSTPGVTAEPAPAIVFVGFGSSSLDFAVRAWTNNFSDWVVTKSALTVRIHDALKDAGIEIPFPQNDLHLRSISPEASAQLRPPA